MAVQRAKAQDAALLHQELAERLHPPLRITDPQRGDSNAQGQIRCHPGSGPTAKVTGEGKHG